MSGVTFMSALACSFCAGDDFIGAEMMMCVCHYFSSGGASRRQSADRLRNQADVLDASQAELVHRRHHRAVLDFFVGPDDHDLLAARLIFEQLRHLGRELLS